MLLPKKVKYRKQQKGRVKGLAFRGSSIEFGTFALKALEPFWMTAKQIETIRVDIARVMKRQGKLWIRVFPDKPITKKPAEVRMGKGKGAPEYWVSTIKPGRILAEIDGVSLSVAIEAFRIAGNKLPVKSKLFVRSDYKNE